MPDDPRFHYMRVTQVTIMQAPNNPDFYDVIIEASNSGLSSTGGAGAPPPGNFPHPPLHYYAGTMTFINSDGGGGGGWGYATMPPSSQTQSSTNTAGGIFQPSTTYNGEVTLVGENPSDLAGLAMGLDTTPIYGPGGSDNIGWYVTPPNGSNYSWAGSFTTQATLPPGTVAHMNAKAQGISAPAQLVTVTWWFDPVGWQEGGPPSPGQWVLGEIPSMAGAVGTLDFPYANGSLRVTVDGILISAASITETNPAAGTFTLAWSPDPGETVVASYQGR